MHFKYLLFVIFYYVLQLLKIIIILSPMSTGEPGQKWALLAKFKSYFYGS
jgi:hypothetical protein